MCIDLTSHHLISTDQRKNLPLLLPKQFPLAEAAVSIRISEKTKILPASEVEIMPQVEGHGCSQELGYWKKPPGSVHLELFDVH